VLDYVSVLKCERKRSCLALSTVLVFGWGGGGLRTNTKIIRGGVMCPDLVPSLATSERFLSFKVGSLLYLLLRTLPLISFMVKEYCLVHH
jgi:hypothetical protein